jgi:hypothetical protein
MTRRDRLAAWLAHRPDDALLRTIFAAMLVGTAGVLALDYQELAARAADPGTVEPASRTVPAEPLPAVEPDRDGPGPATQPSGRLRQAMSFDLIGDGRLMATGTIQPGTAAAFAAEIGKRGGYVKTVILRSPGGSVTDALAMGRLIRSKGFATEVETGGYCASSCPLVFAGGVQRRAAPKASIGVHQVTALSSDGKRVEGGAGSAQRVSALCQKYLREMGVDLQVWVHAMETPADRLYYFKPDELLSLKLATGPMAATTATR